MLYGEIQKVNYTLASQNDIDYDDIVNRLQKINNELSSIFAHFDNYNELSTIKSAFFFFPLLFVFS